MRRLLVVVTRDARLEGTVADAAHDAGADRVFTLRGREVERVRSGERYVVRMLPSGRFPIAGAAPSIAAAG